MIQIISLFVSSVFILLNLFLLAMIIGKEIQFSKTLYKHKATRVVYWILRFMIAFPLVRAIQTKNYESILLCIMALVLMLMPSFIERRLKIEFPSVMEIIILCFIFAHEILGEIGAFYVRVQGWDTMLHTLSGFLLAAIGFCLFDLLNRSNKVKMKLSPFYLSLVAFCFSMTIGVCWEFVEYSADHILLLDMQKDVVVTEINSVALDPTNSNIVMHYQGIDHTIVYLENGEIIEMDGYLDLGINDTMKDLFVCFIGALTFSIIGYFYVKYENHQSIAKYFIPIIHEFSPADKVDMKENRSI